MSCHLRVGGHDFPPEDVRHAVQARGLLAIEVELDGGSGLGGDVALSAIAQARELGARQLTVGGAEPMRSPQLLEVLACGRRLGMQVDVFTNGSRIDRDTAERLFSLGVGVVLERSSLVAEVQDRLAGQGAHVRIETAYRNLRDAGYPSGGRLLGISSVIRRENLAEVPRLWEWIRGEGLVPYIELTAAHDGIPCGDAATVAPPEYRALVERLAVWDREHAGVAWDPQPPLVACLRHRFSCAVDAAGRVLPCAGLRIPVGDLRERSLREILDDSEVMQNLRDHRHTITGPCAICASSASCCGCRGSAYGETGDYLASDPRCWHDSEHGEIARMPLAAAPLIPQHDPMRLVDTLRSVGERVATAGVTVRAEMPFVDGDGILSEAAYLEMIAQAAAAMGGFAKRGNGGLREEGLMLGTRNLEILGEARIGDELEIEVFKSARLGGFGIVEGRVRRQAEVLARGEIKILQLGPRGAS